MLLDLKGKRAVVTGASKGIGLAIVAALVNEGATVTAGSRTTTPELRALVDSGHVTSIEVDLASSSGPHTLVTAALTSGPIDIVINNVGGVTPRMDGFLSVTDDDWSTTINLSFFAAVRTSRAALPGMIAARGGTIVTVCSVNSFLPDPSIIDYCAAKAALANFSKALSKEMGPHGIRVNTVSPGPVSTGLWLGDNGVAATVARSVGGTADAVAAQLAADTATGRFTTPVEVADAVVFLASNRSGNTTGTDLVIDGGLIKTL